MSISEEEKEIDRLLEQSINHTLILEKKIEDLTDQLQLLQKLIVDLKPKQ